MIDKNKEEWEKHGRAVNENRVENRQPKEK
jgi:hypothetical protein